MGEGDTILSGAEGQFPEDLIQNPSRPPAEALSEYKDLKSKVQSELETLAYGLDLSLDHMKFSIAESELFEPNSSELKPGADKILQKVGKLVSHYSGYMTISGNVDAQSGADQNAGVSSYEFTLSRAVSVMNYFVQNRYMPEDRIYPIGRGGRRAIASNTTTDGRKKNRRIEFNLSYNKQM